MESNASNQSSVVPKVVGGIVAILVCCSCVLIFAAGWFIYQAYQNTPIEIPTQIFPPLDSPTPQPVPTIDRTPTDVTSPGTMEILNQTMVPENDPYDLACRLRQICDVAQTVPGKSYQAGDKEKFWILNMYNTQYRQIITTLLYITPHAYFWAEDGVEVNQSDVEQLMDTFENKIYPKDRSFFGNEANPGVDGDPHLFVIYASDLGGNTVGYFNPSDTSNPLIDQHSNAHETFILSTRLKLTREFTYGTLAHEFVHMIQNAYDRNEVSWITEGSADLGMFLNGYDIGGHDWLYIQNPDLQLTTWGGAQDDNIPHYGAAFLYMDYFLDRFGEDATKALIKNPKNDISSVDDTLAQLNITDPQTGEVITADDVFMDWTAAMYLRDGSVGDGRFTYHNYPDAPQTRDTEEIGDCPSPVLDRSVNQYGIDYININCPGDHTLHFRGSTVSGLLPADAYSGGHIFWSNKGDESDMTLTREFDFKNFNAPIKISYQTWYNIEENWDYLYLEASTDGETWEILKTPSGTDYNPVGNSYGWGYTGASNGWILEEVDLSQFAGQKVQVRFEYVTDAAVNEEGLMLDDISIEAINYTSDFEADDGGWEGAGFVRIQNVLPQTYRLTLITKSDTTTVTHIALNTDNTADIPISLKRGDEVILIVTGTTRFTTIPAPYQMEAK